MKFDPALVAFSLFSFSLLRSRDPSLNDYVASKVFPFVGKLFLSPSLFISR